jgi:hypothetical protein
MSKKTELLIVLPSDAFEHHWALEKALGIKFIYSDVVKLDMTHRIAGSPPDWGVYGPSRDKRICSQFDISILPLYELLFKSFCKYRFLLLILKWKS